MTSFVHREYAQEHPGVMRAEQAVKSLGEMARGISSPRATASLLLAAVVSALVVIANQVIDSWSDGHLMAAWIVLWAVAFAAIGLLAEPIRQAVGGVRRGIKQWTARRRQSDAEDQLWSLALKDARVMAEISRAMSADSPRQ